MLPIEFGDVLARLSLDSQPGVIFNVMLYVMFVLNLLAFGMQDDQQLSATLLVGLTLILIVISKLNLIAPDNLLIVPVFVALAVLPLFVTALSRSKRARPLTLLAGATGVVYNLLVFVLLR